jgi:hypothetical protein
MGSYTFKGNQPTEVNPNLVNVKVIEETLEVSHHTATLQLSVDSSGLQLPLPAIHPQHNSLEDAAHVKDTWYHGLPVRHHKPVKLGEELQGL